MAETVSTPGTPAGSAHVKVAASTTYTTTGATSSLGHALQYRWTWGDGDVSDWLSAAEGLSEAHTFAASAARSITVAARCAEHTTITATSAALAVKVYGDSVAAPARTTATTAATRTTGTP